ncbi:ABC transporter ATP-binding protein [Frankia sp. QA3]|uniref:ABC transporter ATP-binding protein n=1 Tax=Frankia sp. QA3 TaxID=710111 RepID=UPI000269CA60|nr:ABC transporter ATP-binding protein [Frankia sp. QA3]EIV94731.1 ABC-type multidrug transport system, ATPase and permease component [Frankia sp. QA3]
MSARHAARTAAGAAADESGTAAARRVLRRLLPLVRPERGLLLGATALVLASTAGETATVWLFGRLTDSALVQASPHAFLTPAVLWLAVAVAGGVCSYVGHCLQAKASGRLLARLRELMLDRLHAMSPTFFAQRPAGDLMTRFGSDVDAVDELAASGLVGATTAGCGVVCFTAAAFVLRWDLALLACAAAPLYWLLTRRLAGRVHEVSQEERAAEGRIAAVVEENITANALIQTHGMAKPERRRLRHHSMAWFEARLVAYRMATANAVLATLLETVFVLAVLYMGTWEISEGRLTIGGLLSFAGFLGYLYGPVQELGELVVSISTAVSSGERIIELLDHPAEVEDHPDARPLQRVRGHICFERVGLTYSEAIRPALDDVSFTLRPGELSVLTGSSGVGKSTLTKLMVRLHDPSAGRVLLDGHDLRDVTLASLRRAVTVVAQDSQLVDGTLWENLTWGIPDADPDRVVAAARAAGVHGFGLRLPDGYETPLGQGGRRLSGGQRRRVSIARALLRDSPVLILDEPTAGLDDDVAGLVVRSLRRLAAHRTVLVITHDMRLVAQADALIVLDRGGVIDPRAGRRPRAGSGAWEQPHAGEAHAGEARTGNESREQPGRPLRERMHTTGSRIGTVPATSPGRSTRRATPARR